MPRLALKPLIPVARCPNCGVETLLYASIEERTGELVRRCSVCDRLASQAGGEGYEMLAPWELAEVGFAVSGPVPLSSGCGGQGCSDKNCATCNEATTCGKIH